MSASKGIKVKILANIKFSFRVTLNKSDERQDIRDGTTADDNKITPDFLPQVPQEQETHCFTNRITLNSAGQASIEQNVLVGNSACLFRRGRI